MGRRKHGVLSWIGAGVLLLVILPACGKEKEAGKNAENGGSKNLTENSQPAPTNQPTLTPVPTETLPFDPESSYTKLELREGAVVYLCEEEEKPQAILELSNGDAIVYRTFDWEYSLKYGKPLVWNGELDSFLVLPTAEMAEPLSPVGAYEVCGEIYKFEFSRYWMENLGFDETYLPQAKRLDNIRPYEFLEESIAKYCVDEDGKKVFTLELSTSIRPTVRQFFEFPELQLPEQEEYPLVFENTSHFTETCLEYRRVGVSAGDSTVWLGKFCIDAGWEQDWDKRGVAGSSEWDGDYLFFPEKGLGYYAGSSVIGMPAEGAAQDGLPSRLEMDDMADLDKDGKLEQISYRKLPADWNGVDLAIYVDGEKVFQENLHLYYSFAEYPCITSLDGENIQLLLMDYGVGRSNIFHIYRYEDGGLWEAGIFEAASYGIEEEEGRNIYCVRENIYPLQNDAVIRKYEFSHGSLHEMEQEYYKFLAAGWGDGNGSPSDRNVFTVKQDISLYYEKGGGETFLLPAGSHAVTLGGDLKEWILIENRDTEEQGWLQVQWDGGNYYSVFTCILPDGSKVDCQNLFEGLLNYD